MCNEFHQTTCLKSSGMFHLFRTTINIKLLTGQNHMNAHTCFFEFKE